MAAHCFAKEDTSIIIMVLSKTEQNVSTVRKRVMAFALVESAWYDDVSCSNLC